MSSFGNFVCNKNCKLKWVVGKGSFIGYKLLLCKKHQIIYKTIKDVKN